MLHMVVVLYEPRPSHYMDDLDLIPKVKRPYEFYCSHDKGSKYQLSTMGCSHNFPFKIINYKQKCSQQLINKQKPGMLYIININQPNMPTTIYYLKLLPSILLLKT